jgi:hypothetical protein
MHCKFEDVYKYYNIASNFVNVKKNKNKNFKRQFSLDNKIIILCVHSNFQFF